VGIPLEVDKNNLRRWEYVRVKIGCRDISKVPATMEGLLDLYFFDFSFQREVVMENASSAWNTWIRNADRSNEDNPTPKKLRKERVRTFIKGASVEQLGKMNKQLNSRVVTKGSVCWQKRIIIN
jgi:hypothetical protein